MENILVCVTQQKNCKNLINYANDIKDFDDNITVINVVGENQRFLNFKKDDRALEYLFKISKSFNAQMVVMKNNDIADTLINYAKNNKIAKIILGHSKEASNAIYKKLTSSLRNVEVIEV